MRALALDEVASLLAVEFLLDPAGGEQEDAQIIFFELDGGYIAGTIVVESGAQFIAGDGNSPPRPPRGQDESLPESVRLPIMTPRKFRDYLDLFGRFDERFVEYYTPDVVFAADPAPVQLHGREAVLELYRPLRAELGENVTVHHLAIDNEAGIMIAALSNCLTAFGNVKLPSRQLGPGDQLALSGAIIYELREGAICRIRDVGG
ncbi:MAG: nuclear transport factor 2 family protein [Novosphingobium sp.]